MPVRAARSLARARYWSWRTALAPTPSSRLACSAGRPSCAARTAVHLDHGADQDPATPDDERTTTVFHPNGWEAQRLLERRGTAGFSQAQLTTWDYHANGDLRRLTTLSTPGAMVAQHDVGYLQGGAYLNGHRTSDAYFATAAAGDPTPACGSAAARCSVAYSHEELAGARPPRLEDPRPPLPAGLDVGDQPPEVACRALPALRARL